MDTRVLIASIISMAFCLPASARSYAGELFSVADVEAVRAFLRANVGDNNTGMVIGLLDEDGSRVFNAGRLDNGSGQEVNGNTIFEIGSITKTFTVLLLMDMVRRGEMKLGDPVSKYLPDAVTAPAHDTQEITLFNLAAQDSGLPFDATNLAIG